MKNNTECEIESKLNELEIQIFENYDPEHDFILGDIYDDDDINELCLKTMSYDGIKDERAALKFKEILDLKGVKYEYFNLRKFTINTKSFKEKFNLNKLK